MHIAIHLDSNSKTSLQMQIYEQLVDHIRAGRLKSGGILPSSRDLSKQLGVSRNTVTEAYEKLIADGYIHTAPQRGTFVRGSVPEDAMSTGARKIIEKSDMMSSINLPLPYGARGLPGLYAPPDVQIRTDFRFGRSDPHSFPDKTWRRLLLECLGGASERISQYNDPAGILELRDLIANYLGPSRGMSVTADNVVIVGGFQQGINLAAHLMVGVNTPVVMEAPCYRGAAFLFETYGGRVIPVPVDDNGIDVERLPDHRVKLVYVTPSHQFPTGGTMSLERRLALLRWAAKTGAYILEVDYDSDFRYEGTLLPSLQSLDRNGCVIYLNSFSRSIGPGLRLGYMIVPRDLLNVTRTLKALIDNGSPWLEQATLAQFMKNGSLTSHLKRLRNTYRDRRDEVRSSIERHFGEARLTGDAAGTHMLWSLPDPLPPAAELQAIARGVGVGVHGLRSAAVLHEGMLPDHERKVLLGYVHLTPTQIDDGFTRIAGALSGTR
ncbi:PLP-dependent aminotransferase family protein [Bradyrhizobium tropiciagri]|uniref:MocR-like pyridoxine biosynthesis transcription factor PdxR n=1 Tax=Bradyrhizobium tropiciagri TaxID=312253 RepID=UPI001BAADA83|nr:PLP-dependent aminotransferase family protein [Bradyrhizobium tropiciagri]MBR0899011.1 PLP-dependent aminotransferase family protein [Bradyrhizobium tropiciagri]